MFLTTEDYKAVSDEKTLEIINRSDTANLERAENYAIEEIKSYLRAAESGKTGIQAYDADAAFEKQGDERNGLLVMYACDIALYHLIAWLPKRMGFEIRETRYEQAIQWLQKVQDGTVLLDIPLADDNTDSGDSGGTVRWGGIARSSYDW